MFGIAAAMLPSQDIVVFILISLFRDYVGEFYIVGSRVSNVNLEKYLDLSSVPGVKVHCKQ